MKELEKIKMKKMKTSKSQMYMLEVVLTGKSLQHHCQRQTYIELPLPYCHTFSYVGGIFTQILDEIVILKSENLTVFNIKSKNSASRSMKKYMRILCAKKKSSKVYSHSLLKIR